MKTPEFELFRHGRSRKALSQWLATAIFVTVATVAAATVTAHASESTRQTVRSGCEPGQALRWRAATVRLDNDSLTSTGRDRDYTNGITLAMVSNDIEGPLRPECMPAPIGLYAALLKWSGSRPSHADGGESSSMSQNLVVRLTQAIHTPGNPFRRDLIRNDRPYAGMLALGVAWNRRMQPAHAGYEMLETRDLSLGIIGPWALARQAQDVIHDLTGYERFHGWRHQLRNEPAFQFAIERRFKPTGWPQQTRSGWNGDLIANYGARIGNIETAASAGIQLRAGWRVPDDFGTYPVRSGAENIAPSPPGSRATKGSRNETRGLHGAHLFAGLDVKGVAWSYALDGNSFAGSHHVNRRPWVGQVVVGISAQASIAGHPVQLSFAQLWLTREFEGQPSPHRYGSVVLGMRF